VTDGLNHTTSYAYDARDRLVSATQPSGGGTTTYAYDAHSRLLSLTDPVGNVTSYGYDAANRVTTETDPRGKVTTNAYDLVGNRTQKTDRDGRVTQYGYDADNRRTTETWVSASPSETVTMTYDAAGRETGIQDAFSQYAYTYDNANRLTSVDNAGTPTDPHVILSDTYDNAGNRTGLTDSFGGLTSYTYDVRNELTSLTQSGTGVAAKRADFAYDAAGRTTSLTRYSDLAGTATVLATAFAYDNANRLTSLTHETALSGGTVRASYAYTLDAADRLTQEARTWNGGATTNTLGYTYTANDQLTGVTHTNASFANESFGYDANGNRNAAGYSTATGNRLTGDGTSTYGYDDEGNLTSRTQISSGNQTLYTWDYRNRLTAVDSKVGGTTTPVARYTYDALGRRLGVVEGASATWTVYDGPRPVLDFNGSGVQTARYLNGPTPAGVDGVLARETPAGGVAWYLSDRLGTVRDLVNNSGVVIDHVDYGAFGTVTGETNPSQGDRFKFAGLEYDAATGLNLAVHRVLLSPAGIWTSTDPMGFAAGDPNLYRFVGNRPSDMIDPMGLQVPMAANPKPASPPLTSPYPRQSFPGPSYIGTQFPKPVFPTTPFGNSNIGAMGCIGLTSLRTGVYPPMALNKGSTALAWFDNPAAAQAYYNSMSGSNPNLMIFAIQSPSIPNIGYVTPYPGMIYPIGGQWNVGGLYNYATWNQPPGGVPFWEYANNGNLSSGTMNAIRCGTLSGAPYNVTIYGLVLSKSPYMLAK